MCIGFIFLNEDCDYYNVNPKNNKRILIIILSSIVYKKILSGQKPNHDLLVKNFEWGRIMTRSIPESALLFFFCPDIVILD